MIKIKVSYGSVEEKESILKDMEGLKYLKVTGWPKKEHPGKGKSTYSNIYLELSLK
ncbi:MAG: hypothetical protein AB9844_09320 [Clostridiaceae bacterium]